MSNVFLTDVPKLPASLKKSEANASHGTSLHGDVKSAERFRFKLFILVVLYVIDMKNICS